MRKSALVLFGIDLVQNVQLLRRGVHILRHHVEDAAHAAEIVVRAGVNGLVPRIVGMQAVRLVLLDEGLARNDKNADLARLKLRREFHQQIIAAVEGGQHTVAGNGDDRVGAADVSGITQENGFALVGVLQRRAGTGRGRQRLARELGKRVDAVVTKGQPFVLDHALGRHAFRAD